MEVISSASPCDPSQTNLEGHCPNETDIGSDGTKEYRRMMELSRPSLLNNCQLHTSEANKLSPVLSD